MGDFKSNKNCFRISEDEFYDNNELQTLLKNEGSVFQQIEFLKVLGDELTFIIATRNDKICGVLPLVATRKVGFKAYHKPPYAHIYGPLIAKPFIKDSNVIINELLASIDKFPIVEFKVPIENQDVLPYVQVGATVSANQTHIILNDTNYGTDKVHSSKRRYLKKLNQELERGGLILHEGANYNDQILWLQKQVSLKNGFRSYLNILEKIMNSLRKDQAYSLLISTADGEPLAGAYCPYDKQYVYHLINASVRHSDSLLNRANILSTYLAISKAMKKGLNFDFEGSSISGVASFYRMMGGQPKTHFRVQIPRNIIGKAYYALKQF